MANETLDFLIKRYGAREWLEPAAAETERAIGARRRVSPKTLSEGMPGLRGLRVQELEIPAEAMDVANLSRELRGAQRAPGRLTDSVWTPDDEEADQPRRLVHLRTFECESAAAARAQLLMVLAEMQGPTVERTGVAGEVAFATPENTTIAGVRGNVVFLLTNGGPELVDLSGIASGLDERLGNAVPA